MKVSLKEHGIIAIMRGIPDDKLIPVAEALYDGGIRVIECTFEHDKDDCIERLQRKISILKSRFGSTMMIGAGTVLSVEEVEKAYEAGAEIIVTPNTKIDVVKKTKERDMVAVIGALTPTEIVEAYDAGADIVKIFPGGNIGVDYFKSIRGPLGYIPMAAVGNIKVENIEEFAKAGAVGFGIGSPLIPKEAVENERYDKIRALAEEYSRLFIKFIL